jgi:hypothetical protein
VLPALPAPSFIDTDVVPCQTYDYLLESIDGCGVRGSSLTSVSAVYATGIKPRAPEYVQALTLPGAIQVTWHPVTEDTAGTPITIKKYRVYRTDFLNPGAPPLSYPHSFEVEVENGAPPGFIDPISIPAGKTAFYRVTAKNKCSDGTSLPSHDAEAGCFQGTMVISSPAEGALALPPETVGVHVDFGAEPFQQLVLEFYNDDTEALESVVTCAGSIPADPCVLNFGRIWRYHDWGNVSLDDYTIRATVTDANSCHRSIEVHVGPNDNGHLDP